MAEVYSTVNFVNPSPYTPISFTPDARFTKIGNVILSFICMEMETKTVLLCLCV